MDTLETFIVKSLAKFGNKFDFSKSVYIKSKELITIICPIHGEFTTTPSTFLSSKFGCKECYNDSKKDIKFTTEEWILKAKEVHNDKYSYEHTVYEGSHKTIIVTCPIHGDFETKASRFLQGHGCPKCKGDKTRQCNLSKRDTLLDFVSKVEKIYGKNVFLYDKAIYVNSRTKITLYSLHAKEYFSATPTHILNKTISKKYIGEQYNNNLLSQDEFLQKAINVHGHTYNYSKTIYNGMRNNVIITCPIHGDFEQIANAHINGRGCPECGKIKMGAAHKLTREQFIKRASDIHNNKYDYSLVTYLDIFTAVTIICPEHGPFKLTPNAHLNGLGCPECGKESRVNSTRKSLNDFIEEANLIHNNKYDYSKVNYINNKTNVTVICPEHGEFLTIPSNHLHGVGCPKCNSSSGENIIINYLNTNNIKYYYLYTIPISLEINPSGKGRIDFYIPDLNMFIEYHGRQHYMPVECFGGKLRFDSYLIPRDKYIEEYCQLNQITLVLIKYDLNYKQIIEKLDEIFKNRTGS